MKHLLTLLLLATCAAATALAAPSQSHASTARSRALPIYREAWTHMRAEAWAEAAKAFQQAIDIDAEFEDAYYGLGRANMGLRKYDAAIAAYVKCEELYQRMAGRQFSSAQEAQQYRRDRITEVDELLRQLQSGPQTAQTQDRIRQLQDQKRIIQDNIARGENMSIGSTLPAFVPLALGSAYFRSEKFVDAEREYKQAVQIDAKTGEAWSNLAALYLTTKRYDEADKAVQHAEKAGFKVHPQLKEEIKNKKSGG